MVPDTLLDGLVALTARVPEAAAGGRLDAVAARLFPEHSRSRLKRWIESGELRVDGAEARPRQRLGGGEVLEVRARSGAAEDWQRAQSMPLEAVFEDHQVIVIAKPAGLIVHPGAGHPDGTLVNGLLAAYPELEGLPRAGLVHRLDADTSGLLVVARTLTAHTHLVEALARREVERRYLAVAEGVLTGGRRIDAPIGRDPRHRTRMAVHPGGRPSSTDVRVVTRYARHTLIEARLGSGRTHQIRVHLASVGHPLVGDRTYGARGLLPPGLSEASKRWLRGFPRQALHAARLAFSHPDGRWLEFEAPLPGDMVRLIQLLEQGRT